MIQTKCDQCGKYFEADDTRGDADMFFLNRMFSDGDPWRLCSLACLCALAWELREAQPKLSKSTQEQP